MCCLKDSTKFGASLAENKATQNFSFKSLPPPYMKKKNCSLHMMHCKQSVVWGDNNTLWTIDTKHATVSCCKMYMQLFPIPRSTAKQNKGVQLFIRCITARACWLVALADALLTLFVISLLMMNGHQEMTK